MDINVKNTYDLFFHPFKGEAPTKKGFGRLAASVAIFIGTAGIYHLIVGSIQKWRVTHPGEAGNVSEVFYSVHGSQGENPTQESQDSSQESSGISQDRSVRGSRGENPTQESQDLAQESSETSQELTEPKEDRKGSVLDFTLVGSDEVSVRANLEFLSQKMGFFEALQRFGGKEVGQMQCRSEFSGKTLKLMMDFLSNSSVSLNHSRTRLDELIAAADFYGIPELKLKIESYLFYANHPQVIRPSLWKEWAVAADVGIQVVTDEEAFESLPENMEEILEEPCRIFGGEKRVEETRMHAYIPPGLTAEDLGKILKTRFPETEAGYQVILNGHTFPKMLKGKATVGGWFEMTRDVIPGSREMGPRSQQEMVEALCNEKERYEVPTALETIACCLAWYFNTPHGEFLFSNAPKTYTRCQEVGYTWKQACNVVVGNFCGGGLQVRLEWNYSYKVVGVAAMRKLS